MDFQHKIQLIEDARTKYDMFDSDFKEYLAMGHSLNGAYNYFTVEDIAKHAANATIVAELNSWQVAPGSAVSASPKPLSEHSVKTKLETLNDSVDKPAGNKRLPKHKDA